MEKIFSIDFFTKVACQEGAGYLKRADPDKLRQIFNKYASVEKHGEKFMTSEDFVIKYLGLLQENNCNKNTLTLFSSIVDSNKDGLISYTDFQAFEGLLCYPDALYKTAFHLFDRNGNGVVSFDEFSEVIKQTNLHKRIPFNMDSGFVQLYFGREKSRMVSYNEFSQFLHDFHEEYAVEGFRSADKKGTGFISALDFQDIMLNIKSHLLTKPVKAHLMEAIQHETSGNKISFPYFMAFNNLLNNMELVKRIYLNVTGGHRAQEVSKEEFMHSAQLMSQMTPLEVEVLFHLSEVLHQSGRIVYNNLNTLAPEQYFKQVTRRLAEFKAVSSPEDRGIIMPILESAYRFSLASVAGAAGATAVYPIDLVKTRMQNQRISPSGELMYRHSWDCFKKVVRYEGALGLYRGLLPQIMGVAPEKAIKLTVNDFIRDRFYRKDGSISAYGEVLAGGCAGLSQVIFTNPLEIVKIRLQTAGEMPGVRMRALPVIKELGLFGLYKGVTACIARDIPFSAIYFPAYAHTKASLADENGYNHPATLILAGAIAGVPAAFLATPADVVKTRLQVVARKGQTTYKGVMDATRKIMQEEGFGAFWKGSIPRVCRSSPQFGVTLFTYEILQRFFYIDFGGTRPAGSEFKQEAEETSVKHNPDHIGGYSVSVPLFSGIETKFGLCLPKFRV